jgi:prepilin-type N-terminal cleavage/methylation domain-containing protein
MNNKSIKGFTLIEIVVSVAIFSILAVIFSNFLFGSIRSQQKALASQELIDNVSYNLEYISRAIRMAKKDHDGSCLTTVGAKYNYETNANSDRIRFLNYQDKCQEFYLDNGEIKERKSSDNSAVNFASAVSLTPSNFTVTSFKLGPDDSWSQSQKTQPRITLSLQIEKTESSGNVLSSIDIQTTISQRNLNRIY